MASEAKERVYPGYRMIAHYGGNTYGWPVPADRVHDGLASRIAKLTGAYGTQDEVELAAECALEHVDAGDGHGTRSIELGGNDYPVECRDGEVRLELDGGTIWLSPLDPGTEQGRDTLGAIGVTSYSFPVERGRS